MKDTEVKAQSQTRSSKYCTAILRVIKQLGHATNAQLLDAVRDTYPDVSATTIHRATTRLEARGSIAVAPADKQGAMRYDHRTAPHDHFMCERCGKLRDADIAEQVKDALKRQLPDCGVHGRLTVHGVCKDCIKNKELLCRKY
ncbi:MAG: Fur family transcriptional regulator, peroxide stress response regulator [Patescibacteria group bacterium]|nr:transcriptional repressor [Candidatus Saccharibacteria bacterium]MDQ5963180.1 Fur family transcriptional regulator, peroxide stress response regulator [Patescibacteria group bacterium]